MAKALTAKYIASIKPTAQTQEIRDGGCRCLYLVVHPTGRKSWAVRYRFQGRTRKLTLDAGLTLAEAHKAAAAALNELARGNDPAALKFDAQAKAEQAEADRKRDTVEHHANLFFEQHVNRNTRPKSQQQTRHVFYNIALPAWRSRVIHDIKRRDIHDLVYGVAVRHPVMGNRALAHLSKFFNWLVGRGVIEASPCAGIPRPSKERPRERILSDDEIKALWNACETIGGAAGHVIKLLLLTGQRYSEVVGMRRSEISGDVWTLSPDRTKNDRKHEVPLSKQALAIIEAMPVKGEDFVFTTSKTRRLGNMDRAKTLLDGQMNPKESWVLHDLRRTAASGMQKLHIEPYVIEKCLNHVSGTFRGVAGVYQRHDYAAEKRDALQRWADHIKGLVTGKTQDNIVRMPARIG